MDILFKTTKLRKTCNSLKSATRAWGSMGARKLLLRLVEMQRAHDLAELMTLPQARCHALTENLRGIYSVDLDHPYRLLFKPANDPLPRDDSRQVDTSRVTAVLILEREDTHG